MNGYRGYFTSLCHASCSAPGFCPWPSCSRRQASLSRRLYLRHRTATRHAFILERLPTNGTRSRSNFAGVAVEMSEFPELVVVSRRVRAASGSSPAKIAPRRPRERLVSAGRLSELVRVDQGSQAGQLRWPAAVPA